MRPARRRLAAAALVLVAASPLAACNRGTVPSGKAFCERVSARLAELKGPVTDSAGAKRSVQAYRDLQPVAPAPVRDAWKTVTSLVEAAATLDLTSTDQQGKFAEQALAASGQVKIVTDYTRDTCGLDLNTAG